MLLGQVIVGGVSKTTTLNDGQVATLLALSLAEQVTIVVPRANVEPDTLVQDED
jgi:hypothetical protein